MPLSHHLPRSDVILTIAWQHYLDNGFSLLADETELSIIGVHTATPILLEAIYYQLVKFAHTPTTFHNILSQNNARPNMMTVGLNFEQIAFNRTKVRQTHTKFFPDTRSFWAIIGITSERTHIHPQKLAYLTEWLVFLVLDNITALQHQYAISAHQLALWLPYSCPVSHPLDRTLLGGILLDNTLTATTFFQFSIPADILTTHQTIAQAYHAGIGLGIVPVSEGAFSQNPSFSSSTFLISKNTLPATQPSSAKPPLLADDVFAKSTPTKLSLVNILQKYWIAFSVGLSAIMIAGGSALFASHQPAPVIEPSPTPIKSADMPHDVAIVRTAPANPDMATLTTDKKIADAPKTNTSRKPANNTSTGSKTATPKHPAPVSKSNKTTSQSPTSKKTQSKVPTAKSTETKSSATKATKSTTSKSKTAPKDGIIKKQED